MYQPYLDCTSPKKAFSFAISGGLKVDCALAWYVKGSAMVGGSSVSMRANVMWK
jgi:hypothetical protein